MNYKNYYVYILTNHNNSVFYIGVTNNLARRIYQHKHKIFKGFTNKYNLYKLVYFEHMNDINVAIDREKQLKKLRRNEKIDLIKQDNPKFNDYYDSIIG